MPPEKRDARFYSQFRCPTGVQGREVAALMNREHRALTTWGLKHVRVEPEFVVLDVGCGGGRTVGRLARRATRGKVFGVDHSPDMVKYASETNKNLIRQGRVEIAEGSVENLSFPDCFFDLVTAVETYYFWRSLPDAFREIKRVLKPEGRLLMVNEMMRDGVFEVENAEIIAKTNVHILPLEEIQSLLEDAGFVDVKVLTKAKTPWNAFVAKKPNR